MGIPGAVEATYRNLLHLVQSLPKGAVWSALAIGKNQLPINIHTMLLGGHVRTGFEDNVYYRKGELAKSNTQFVERIVRIAGEVGRTIASPDDARQILQLRTNLTELAV
jgi:3-keto-5-aminohexanoate cleavage enzyme